MLEKPSKFWSPLNRRVCLKFHMAGSRGQKGTCESPTSTKDSVEKNYIIWEQSLPYKPVL